MSITIRAALTILAVATLARAPMAQTPELIYYQFEGGGATVANEACAPVGNLNAPIVGHSLGLGGQFDGGLQGSGLPGNANNVDTGWATNLGSGDWTISMHVSLGTSPGVFQYLMGDVTAGSFRIFANGAAGAGNLVLRGPLNQVIINGGATVTGATVAWVYHSGASFIRGYLNGTLVTTVAQPALNISGAGPLVVGGDTGTGSSGLAAGAIMDEFRLYDRALSAAELASSWNVEVAGSCPSPTPGTLGVPGMNDLLINGAGSGQRSCVSKFVGQGSTLTFDSTGLPDSPITVSTASSCVLEALTIGGATYSLDLDLLTHALFIDGTGAFIPASPLTPFLRTTNLGTFTFSVSVPLPPGSCLGLQMGFFNAGYPLGIAVSQAYDVCVIVPLECRDAQWNHDVKPTTIPAACVNKDA